jgi:hypothetical protein
MRFQRRVSGPRRICLAAIVVVTIMVAIAQGASLSVDVFGALTQPRAVGTIRGVDAKAGFGSRLLPGVGVTLFLDPMWALSAGISRGSTEINVTANGAPRDRSTVSFEERSLVLRHFFPLSDSFALSAGVGAVSLITRDIRRPITSGPVTLIHVSSPDHGLAVVTVGARYRLSSRLSLSTTLEYGSFRSTAEVRRIEFPQGDLETDFHLFVVKTGLGFRF